MSNTPALSSIVAREALAILENMLSFSKNVNREFEDEFTDNMARGYAPGQTINIKKPPRYTYRAGRIATPQATVENTIPLTLSQGGADMIFTSLERTLQFPNSQMEDKIAAAVAVVANEIDRQGLQLAHYATYNTLNPTGARPTSQATALAAATDVGQRLDEMAANRKDGRRAFIMNPSLNGAMVQGFAGLFNSQSKVSEQYNTGMFVDALGFSAGMDQNVDVHTNGAGTASNVNGANQTGATITVAATGAGTITRGTTITLPGVFAVNPVSRQSTGVLANFVITADVPVASTSLPISPAIVTSGAFQNVTASPTTAQPFIIMGAASTSYACNVGYHKDAFTLAMVPMWKPEAGMGARVAQRKKNGFVIKVTDFYDGINDGAVTRLDVLFGWAAPYAELSTKYYTLN